MGFLTLSPLNSILIVLVWLQLSDAQALRFEPPRDQVVILPEILDEIPFLTKSSALPAESAWQSPTASSHCSSESQTPQPQSGSCSYWLENIGHNGVAPFASSGYKVFRNVKDFGAVGDGLHDDTAAINAAISAGGRCAPGTCPSSTITPALVYLPAGTYKISSSIILYYYTQLIGNPNCMPVLKATSNFNGFGLVDADPYQSSGNQAYFNTNVFWRQIRNIVFDMTSIPPNYVPPSQAPLCGIHWPTAQATSLQNLVFRMSDASGTRHIGIFMENGSGGFMTDLVFYGGMYGARWGNQQFTMRNLTFFNCQTAIYQDWDWGWTYKGLSITNCSIGIDMSHAAQVGSTVIIDSVITDTNIAFLSSFNVANKTATSGSLILENIKLKKVGATVQGPTGVALSGSPGASTVAAWGQGHAYLPSGPRVFQGPITPVSRSPNLLVGDAYYQRSKPQYEELDPGHVLSARAAGARGDGVTDDTAALQQAIFEAIRGGKILFVDAGYYRITRTLFLPAGARIVGEAYPVLLASGFFFADVKNPRPVVMVGFPGQKGSAVEWSDVIVSTQGPMAGAILIEWNLASAKGSPSGMWDVHARIGGFTGSGLQFPECPKTPTVAIPPAPVNANCIAAFMSMHVTPFASGLYMENVWLWTADHDIDDPGQRQVTVYAGRGLYIEGGAGPLWLYGTASEHHTFYQYQIYNSSNIFMGQIQTETAYYQPNPPATMPFPGPTDLNDPTFPPGCIGSPGMKNVCDGWGVRIVDSQNVSIYGAGLYSFFDNYDQTCLKTTDCQAAVLSLEGRLLSGINVYNLNTIGVQNMILRGFISLAKAVDNPNGVAQTIAWFRG